MLTRRRCMQALVFVGVELGLVAVTTVPMVDAKRHPRPTPGPTVTPTPTPTVTPTPTPLPTAGPIRPFAAPVTTATYTVPASIDNTGTSDVAAALNQWVAAQPNGSRLVFPRGRYRMSQGLQLANRKDLELVGEGCTLDQVGGFGQLQGNIVLGHQYGGSWTGLNERVAIHGFTLVNHNPTPGVFSGSREGCHAIEVEQSSGVDIWGITAQGIGGDLVKVGNSTDVWVHDSHATDVGRQGLTVLSGQYVTMSGCTVDAWGYYCIDVEPNLDTEFVTDVRFAGNTFGRGGPDTGVGHGFAAVGSGTAYLAIGRIHITDNAVTGSTNSTLVSYVNQNQHRRLSDIEFSRNRSAQAGGVAEFKDVDRLTIIGNTAAGAPLTCTTVGCTGVVS